MDEQGKVNTGTLNRQSARESFTEFRQLFLDWKWIFGYTGNYRWHIVLYSVIGILGSSLSIASALVSKYLIDAVIGKDTQMLVVLVFLMILSTGFSLLLSGLSSRLSAKLVLWVSRDIRADLFGSIFQSDWEAMERFSHGDYLSRLNQDVGYVAANAATAIPALLFSVYHFIATFCVIAYYDLTMAGIALLSAPVMVLLSRYIMRGNREHRRKSLEADSSRTAFLSETMFHVDLIKSFDAVKIFQGELSDCEDRCRDAGLSYHLFHIKTDVFTKLTSSAVSLMAFGYCLACLYAGTITFGTMTLFLQQRGALSSRFQSLFSQIPGMINSAVSARRIREVIEMPREERKPDAFTGVEFMSGAGITVSLSDVAFSYGSRKVLKPGNFRALPGKLTAIIGPSGEGKTTLLRLILCLIRPDSGKAELCTPEGCVYEICPDFRSLMAYVPQGNSLIAGTIGENLRMARPNATDEQLMDALDAACALDFVQKLPGGINALVGQQGRGLSQGQAQRIAIARALLRNAPILLLDEATSALDPGTEQRVLESIKRNYPGITCILSTHRNAVLEQCDAVYRISGGCIEQVR